MGELKEHRWLNNDQAAADSARFMANVKFPGIDENLTAPDTPWIYYGVRIYSQRKITFLTSNTRVRTLVLVLRI
jgi:hypothetical protein